MTCCALVAVITHCRRRPLSLLIGGNHTLESISSLQEAASRRGNQEFDVGIAATPGCRHRHRRDMLRPCRCHCPLMSSPAVFTQHCHGRSGRHQGGDTIPHHQAQHHTHVSSYRRQSNFGIHILSPGSSIQGSLSRIQCRYHCNSWLSTLSLILLLLLYSVLSPSVAIEIPTLPPSSVSCCCRPHLHYGSYLMRMPHCLP